MSTQGKGTSVPVVFNFNSIDVRTVIRDGAVWFIAADVCAALGYKNTSDAIASHLDNDERAIAIVPRTPSDSLGVETNVISESGLYALVLRSRKPAARQFAKWVTSEVLPTIRKTGSYQAPSKPTSAAIKKPSHELHERIKQRAWGLAQADYDRYLVGMHIAHQEAKDGAFDPTTWSPTDTSQAIINDLEAVAYVLNSFSKTIKRKQTKLAAALGVSLPAGEVLK